MANEKRFNFNNGESVVKKFEEEVFSKEFTRLRVNESGVGEVTITDDSIKNNAEFIVNLFDEG